MKDRNTSFPLFLRHSLRVVRILGSLLLGPGTEEIEGRKLSMFASQDETWESVLYSTVHVFSTIELCAEELGIIYTRC